jgi:arylsulfatase
MVAVDVKRRSHRITADVEVPADGADGAADGVLIAMGAILGGFTIYIQDGRLQYVHNFVGRSEDHIAAPDQLTPGPHTVEFAYHCDDPFGGGRAQLVVDGTTVAEGEIKRFTPVRWSITGAGITVGYDGPSAVTPRYEAPFRYQGTLHRVVVDVDPSEIDPSDVTMADLRARGALSAD